MVAAIEEAGVKEQRNRALPARLMVYFTLALWLDFGKGYMRVLTGLRWTRGGWGGYGVPTDGAISLTRGRLGDKPLKLLFDQSARVVGTRAASSRLRPSMATRRSPLTPRLTALLGFQKSEAKGL